MTDTGGSMSVTWLRTCEASTCVEAAWQRACSSATNCVEAHGEADRVLIRDSKHPDGPVLTLTMAEWWWLVRAAALWNRSAWIETSTPDREISVERTEDDKVVVAASTGDELDAELRFTLAEWDAFVAGLRSGAFDSIGRDARPNCGEVAVIMDSDGPAIGQGTSFDGPALAVDGRTGPTGGPGNPPAPEPGSCASGTVPAGGVIVTTSVVELGYDS